MDKQNTTRPTHLAQPIELRCGVHIKNRFFKSAMHEAMADRDHAPTERFAALYRQWAEGGAGVLMTGNVMVDHTQLGEPGNVALEDDSNLAPFRSWAEAGTVNGMQCWMQLNHPGRQSPATINPHPWAPSAGKLEGEYGKFFAEPRELDRAQIHDIQQRFATAARLAKQAGFTGVQLHGAHGYLINQFLSPLDNQRTDEYGGSLDNRMRFLVETYQAVREAVGSDFPVAVKLNSSDGQEGGFSEDESLTVIQRLADLGVDLVEISGGTLEKPTFSTNTGDKEDSARGVYFSDFATRVKQLDLHGPVVCLTGGFRTPADMEDALEQGITDMIGIARPLVLQPDMPQHILDGDIEPTNRFKLPWITTGVKSLDKAFNGVLVISWFELQMNRIGTGKNPDPNIGGMRALLFALKQHGPAALSPRRRKNRN